jgi:hypothetical protein
MQGHECYHCKQWVEAGEPHDCWTTTETALTADLSEDLRDAYVRLRESALEFGDQRVYASHSSIMFSRKACYFFVRPKRNFLEVCVFLGRTIVAPQVRKTMASSKVKVAHLLQIRHRDEVEAPLTDWLREAYQLQDAAPSPAKPKKTVSAKSVTTAKRKAVAATTRRAKTRVAKPHRATTRGTTRRRTNTRARKRR